MSAPLVLGSLPALAALAPLAAVLVVLVSHRAVGSAPPTDLTGPGGCRSSSAGRRA